MILAIRKRLERKQNEGGFTLIELMVVVLIIAILIAIAIPTFLGARKRAQDRAAQSNIRNVLTAEKTYYTDAQAYTASETDIEAIEPAIQIQATDPPTLTGNNVTVVLSSGTVYISAKSASGSCFYVKDDAASATQFTKDTDGTCSSSTTVTGWSTTPW